MKHNVVVLLLNDNFTTNEIPPDGAAPPFECSKGGYDGHLFIRLLELPQKLIAPTAAVPCYPAAGCHS